MTQLPLTGAGPSAAGYIAKVKSYNPISYWPLNELTGSTAICQINTAQNGTYTGVTLGQSVTDASGVSFICPLFDGTNDFVNIYSATLNSVFDGDETTIMVWGRVFDAGVWTDGNFRFVNRLSSGATYYYDQFKFDANNKFQVRRRAGGSVSVDDTPFSSVNWFHSVHTCSRIADEYKYFRDGSQIGTTQAGMTAWANNLLNTQTVIGAQTTAPVLAWYGWLAHCAIWDTPLTPTQIADLAVA
jgi:hypothetical protein